MSSTNAASATACRARTRRERAPRARQAGRSAAPRCRAREGARAGRAGARRATVPRRGGEDPPRPCAAPDGAHPRVLEEPLQHRRKRGPARIGAGALRRAAVEPGAAHELLHGGPPRPERVDSSVMQSLVCENLRLATGSSAAPATHRGVRLARRFGASCPRTKNSPSRADPPIPVVALGRARPPVGEAAVTDGGIHGSGAAMRALVAGATGFVGGNLARALLREDVEVRTPIRREGPHLALEGLRAERTPGDVEDPESLHVAPSGCDAALRCRSADAVHPPRRSG